MDNPATPALHPRRNPLLTWLVLGGLFSISLYVTALYAVIPAIRPTGFDPYPSKTMIAPLSVMASFGISLSFACLWANRRKLRHALKPNFARVISAIILAGFCPIGFFWYIPIFLGFAGLGSLFGVVQKLDRPGIFLQFLQLQLWILAATLVAYPLACALIYGLPLRWRVPAFLATIAGPIALLLLWGFRTKGQL